MSSPVSSGSESRSRNIDAFTELVFVAFSVLWM